MAQIEIMAETITTTEVKILTIANGKMKIMVGIIIQKLTIDLTLMTMIIKKTTLILTTIAKNIIAKRTKMIKTAKLANVIILIKIADHSRVSLSFHALETIILIAEKTDKIGKADRIVVANAHAKTLIATDDQNNQTNFISLVA